MSEYEPVYSSAVTQLPLTPIGDRILVLPDAYEEQGVIVIPESVKDSQVEMSGTVAMIGPGPRCEECAGRLRSDLAVGNRVIFAPNVGSEVTVDGVRYLVMAEDDVLGVVEE